MTKEDNDKISEIICDVWNNELDSGNEEINIWISFFMSFGFSSDQILIYGKKYGLGHDPTECDPDDPNDIYGALVITQKDIDKISFRRHGSFKCKL